MKKIALGLLLSISNSFTCDPISMGSICSKANGKTQEDRAIIARVNGNGFFGVFDGHGGADVAQRLQKDFPSCFFKSLQGSGCISDVFSNVFACIEKETISNSKMRKQGSTAVVAYLEKDKLTVANIGDSSLVLGNNKGVVFITKPHVADKEQNLEELKRVLKVGRVFREVAVKSRTTDIIGCGPWRVNGLMPTRTIGDSVYKNVLTNRFYGRDSSDGDILYEAYNPDQDYNHQREGKPKLLTRIEIQQSPKQIIADPECTEIKLKGEETWLLLGTDGFFDYVSYEDALSMAEHQFQQEKSEKEIAEFLVDAALKSGKNKDNVTVIVYNMRNHFARSK